MAFSMMWWKDIALLKKQVQDVQSELEKEQNKASRLGGFIARLQAFGVTPTGRVPRREFAEALIDAAHELLKVEHVILFQTDNDTLDHVPLAARGFSPQILSRMRIRPGEGVLGQSAQTAKTVIVNTPGAPRASLETDYLTAPYMIIPLLWQGRCGGLLAAAKPQAGTFSAEDRGLLTLLAAQAALVLEGHSLFENLGGAREQMVETLVRALEAKDSTTHAHSYRTRALVRALTQEMSLPEVLVQQIEDGALLHDIGKIGIEDAILKKTSELTPVEYDVMKTHALMGQSILEPFAALRGAAAIVLYHQEWYNGAGYPEGLAGEEIPLGARLVQILDAWDAMTSDRPYRKAMPKSAAITELRRQAGSQFDPKLVELFLRVQDRLEREGIPTTEQPGTKPLAAQGA
jgi:HD-GYP domain-containing protein (c-di-GMP phosphodiesterase class II)